MLPAQRFWRETVLVTNESARGCENISSYITIIISGFISFVACFLDFSGKRPSSVSENFLLNQRWWVNSELTVHSLSFYTQDVVTYHMTSSLEIQGSCMDNNHSHFLLVDDGTEGKYGGEIAFRARLQNCLSNKEISKSNYLGGSVFF